MAVEFVKNNKVHRVKATREIILSAGTIGSAQIMMLSGLGPKKHLEDLKARLPSTSQEHSCVCCHCSVILQINDFKFKKNNYTINIFSLYILLFGFFVIL